MYKLQLAISAIFLIATIIEVRGQKALNEQNNLLLVGCWNSIGQDMPEKNVLYQKDTLSESGKLGSNLYFGQDGAFTDRTILPCGSDGRIHQYDGKWKLINQTEIEIYAITEKYNKAHYYPIFGDYDVELKKNGKFKIVKIEKEILELKIIDNYEILKCK